ncbi:hypothetical protein [Pedobacter mucosus]|uniref:hypothetical protein n=1 Tax=Pedobacter mucosus TaxID=2895286 RepID=UPI001EE3DC37|nr:hypothetical protein [Pedobacter mucosus]UKT65454.1 hypothetical protein LOK61_06620 [Pedobacter mucosus]
MISVHVTPILKILKDNFDAESSLYADKLKQNLINFLFHASIKETWQVKYVNKIIDISQEIIRAKPSELEVYKILFDGVHDSNLVKKIKYKEFRDTLISKMGYQDRRSDFYPTYFQKIGIRSCVYCNSQFALVVDCEKFDKKGQRNPESLAEAKFQIDHFLAKSQYPCFSISVFNLYPVCATCNNIKGGLEVNFKLYNEDDNVINKSNYEFALEKGCVADYLTNNFKTETLKITFNDPDKTNPSKLGKNSLNDTFDIKGIYATQIDIVEEIIQKRRIYNASYKKILVESFPELFNHSTLSERTLLGNYHLSEDIHKRPMAKFMQDIDKHIKSIIDNELQK